MDIHKRLKTLLEGLKNHRYALIVLCVGIVLMLVPTGRGSRAESTPENTSSQPESVEEALERVLSQVKGAGNVQVMLTMEQAAVTEYQSDGSGDGSDTVVITDAQRNQSGLIRTVRQQQWRGAIVVCDGADDPAVRLALVEAVSRVTGLGYDKISVLKIK